MILEKQNHRDRQRKVNSGTALVAAQIFNGGYIASPKFEAQYDFAYFLDQYITRLGFNYTDFARDIDVGLSTISQIIGKHRKPANKIIFRLYIHSNKNFPVYLWYRLLEKERLFELENDQSILENESKFVKHSIDVSLFE